MTRKLKRLAEGKFICPVAYPEEFDLLSEEGGRAVAEAWLEQVGLRLARLSDEGAFFMAYAFTERLGWFLSGLGLDKLISELTEPVGVFEPLVERRLPRVRVPRVPAIELVMEMLSNGLGPSGFSSFC